MRSDRLGLARPLQEEQLWEDSDGFQPDGKRPQDLRRRVLVGEDDGEDERAAEKVLHAEGVDVRVVRGLIGCCHQVDGVA